MTRTHPRVALLSWRVQVAGDSTSLVQGEPGKRDGLQRVLRGLTRALEDHELPFVLGDRHTGHAVAGLRSPSDPVLRAVLCVLRMVEVTRPWHRAWPVQFGIHYGTVRAGLGPGDSQLASLAGLAVTTADAVRDVARPHTVTATSVAWGHVRTDLRGLHRGQIETREAGTLEVIECTGAVEAHHQ